MPSNWSSMSLLFISILISEEVFAKIDGAIEIIRDQNEILFDLMSEQKIGNSFIGNTFRLKREIGEMIYFIEKIHYRALVQLYPAIRPIDY